MYKHYDPERDAPDEPVWYKNLKKAWASNRKIGDQCRSAKLQVENQNLLDEVGTAKEVLHNPEKWFEYCEELEIKRPVGRPKLPKSLKKESSKLKRSDQMKQLLAENGIHLIEKSSLDGPWIDHYLKEYPGYQFLPNGRLRTSDGNTLSVYHFLQNLDTQ